MKWHIIFCILSLMVGFASIFLSIIDPIGIHKFIWGSFAFACGSFFGENIEHIFSGIRR
jgi:hypothetical protein